VIEDVALVLPEEAMTFVRSVDQIVSM
jgi:hypothetical protein